MTGLLRYLGLLNVGVWVGAALSFTFAIGPAFFTDELKAILRPPYNGVAAQAVIERYFVLLHCCGVIAVIHLFLEKLYLGKIIERISVVILSVVIFVTLIGGFWLQPKLKNLHQRWYNPRAPMEQRAVSAEIVRKMAWCLANFEPDCDRRVADLFLEAVQSAGDSTFFNLRKVQGLTTSGICRQLKVDFKIQ